MLNFQRMKQKNIKLWGSVEISLYKPDLVYGCLLGGGVFNQQPRSKYDRSKIFASIILICYDFSVSVSYDYKKKLKNSFNVKENEKKDAQIFDPKENSLFEMTELQSKTLEENLVMAQFLLCVFESLGKENYVRKINNTLNSLIPIRNVAGLKNIEEEMLRFESYLPKDHPLRVNELVDVKKVKALIGRINTASFVFGKKMNDFHYEDLRQIRLKISKKGGRILKHTEYKEIISKLNKIGL
jgi:hypothetical protein